MGLQAIEDGLHDPVLGLLLLDSLIDALLDEDLLQRAGVDPIFDFSLFNPQLGFEDIDEAVDVVLQHLGDGHDTRQVTIDDEERHRDRHLAVGEGIQGIHHVSGIDAAGQLDLYLDILGGEVLDGGNLHLVLARRIFDGVDQRFRRRAVRNLAHDDTLLVRGIEPGPHEDLTVAVFVVGHVHHAAGGKVREHLEGLVLHVADLRFEQFDQVVGHDLRRHRRGDAFGALRQQQRDPHRQDDGLLVAPIVRFHKLGHLRIKDDLPGHGGQPALDIARRRRHITRIDVAEVPLLVDGHILVGQHDEGREDRRISMRVILHTLADDIGHLVEALVVHLMQRMQDPPLHRLQPIIKMRNRPLLDGIRGVLDVILVVELFYVGQVRLTPVDPSPPANSGQFFSAQCDAVS